MLSLSLKTFFIIISSLCLIHFLFKKRQFNFISLGFFSSIFYFLPLYFGYTRGKTISSLAPIHNGVYLIGSFVLFLILIADFIFKKNAPISRHALEPQRNIKFDNSFILNIVSTFSLLGFLGLISTTGNVILSPDKSAMLDKLNRFYTLMVFSTIIGMVWSYMYKKKFYLIYFSLFILFDIFIGFRATASISFLSITTLWLFYKGKSRLIKLLWQSKKQITAIFLLILFFFIYKRIYPFIKIGDFSTAAEILSDIDTYWLAILRSEPFTTQAVLNEIVRSGFTTDWTYLLHNIYQFVPFSNLFVEKVTSFNKMFQPSLFPLMPGGMAGNWWAEWLSAFGWIGVFLATLFYVTGITFFSYMLLRWRNKVNLVVLITVTGVFFAFYINRNEISYFLTLEKRVLIFWFLFVFSTSFFRISKKRRTYRFKTNK